MYNTNHTLNSTEIFSNITNYIINYNTTLYKSNLLQTRSHATITDFLPKAIYTKTRCAPLLRCIAAGCARSKRDLYFARLIWTVTRVRLRRLAHMQRISMQQRKLNVYMCLFRTNIVMIFLFCILWNNYNSKRTFAHSYAVLHDLARSCVNLHDLAQSYADSLGIHLVFCDSSNTAQCVLSGFNFVFLN